MKTVLFDNNFFETKSRWKSCWDFKCFIFTFGEIPFFQLFDLASAQPISLKIYMYSKLFVNLSREKCGWLEETRLKSKEDIS